MKPFVSLCLAGTALFSTAAAATDLPVNYDLGSQVQALHAPMAADGMPQTGIVSVRFHVDKQGRVGKPQWSDSAHAKLNALARKKLKTPPKRVAAQKQCRIDNGAETCTAVASEGIRYFVFAAVPDKYSEPQSNIRPKYPLLSLENEEEDSVLVHAAVDESGKVVLAWIGKSSGFSRLNKAARTAVEQTPFTPATYRSQPVLSIASTLITFNL